MSSEDPHEPGFPSATAVAIAQLISGAPGSIVSRTLKKGPSGSLTLFAFDAGADLSEHTSPYDAFVHVIEGSAELVIGGAPVHAVAGQLVWMPAGVPHAVRAKEPFKMLLTMLRG